MKKTTMVASTMVAFAFVASMMILSNARADLSVRPAKLGVLTIEIFPLSPAVVERSFEVGNTYNTSIYISLEVSGNLSSVMKLSKTQFALEPNQRQEVTYTLSVSKPGLYTGGVLVKAGPEEGSTKIGYQADLFVFARESSLISQDYLIIAVAALFIALAVVVVFYFGKRRAKGRKK